MGRAHISHGPIRRRRRADRLVWIIRRGMFVLTLPESLTAIMRRLPILRGYFADVPGGDWQNHPFDLQYGTSTDGYIHAKDLESGNRNDLFITGYSACQPGILRKILQKIPNHQETIFVDFGCGKGRALVVASEFSFKKVIGVEIAPSLCKVASTNIAMIHRTFPDRPLIELVQGDAAHFVIPPGRVVIFLYNPFHRKLVRRLVSNLEGSIDPERQKIYVVYCSPLWKEAFDRSRFFKRFYASAVTCDPAEAEFAPGPVDDVVIWESPDPDPGPPGSSAAQSFTFGGRIAPFRPAPGR